MTKGSEQRLGLEIERKFLVNKDRWHPTTEGIDYIQGYLLADKLRSVRVRIAGDQGFLTIKGRTQGITRREYEYLIPRPDASEILGLCDQPFLSKTRYKERFRGNLWEIDVFHGDNSGLIIAEIEIPTESYEFERPHWILDEVSDDLRYYNSNLIKNSFSSWQK